MASPPQTLYSATVLSTGTTNGTAMVTPAMPGSNLNIIIVTSAPTGTPSAAFEVQWSNDQVNFASAETPDTFTAITGATSVAKRFAVKGAYYRLKCVVSGAASSLTATATAYTTD